MTCFHFGQSMTFLTLQNVRTHTYSENCNTVYIYIYKHLFAPPHVLGPQTVLKRVPLPGTGFFLAHTVNGLGN